MFKNTISDHPEAITKLKEKYNIKGDLESASLSGIYGEKEDVRISFTCGHYINVNIKGFGEIGFNQLARTSVSKFCQYFNLTEEDKENLENIVIAKSKNPKNPLFSVDDQKDWEEFFNKNASNLIRWGFSKNPSREILALYDRINSIMRIYPMKDALSRFSLEVTFSKGGFNIGTCISFQRKGGNGSLSKHIAKTDIKQPGNNIQMKLKIHETIKILEGVKLAEYVV